MTKNQQNNGSQQNSPPSPQKPIPQPKTTYVGNDSFTKGGPLTGIPIKKSGS